MPNLSRAEIEAQIAALQAELAASEGGVYEDARTGRWFVVLRAPGRRPTTTRRRAPDGSRLLTREQALAAKRQWETQLRGGMVPIVRERFKAYWPRYLRHARGEMTRGSWEDVRAHGTKRLLPYFGELQLARIGVASGRLPCTIASDSRPSRPASGRPRRSTTRGSRCSARSGWRSPTA
jgi:hypothetical protein